MKVDYMKLINESYAFTMKYRVLWLFGFLLALFGGGSSAGGNSNYSSSYSGGTTSGTNSSAAGAEIARNLEQLKDRLVAITHQPWFWPVVITVIVFMIIWMLLAIYVTTMSKIALMNAVKHDNDQKPELIQFSQLWHEGGSSFWGLFFVEFILGLITFIMILLLISPLLLIFFAPLLVVLLICGFILLLPLIIAISFTISSIGKVASRKVVLENTGIMDSIQSGWQLFKKTWLEWIIASLVAIAPAILFGIVILIAGLLVLGIFVGLPAVLVFTSQFAVWSWVLLVIGFIVSSIILSIVISPYKVFTETYWTKFYLMIKQKPAAV